MSLWVIFGSSLVALGMLRLSDIAWPTKLAPWQFYAIEVAVGLVLVWSFAGQAG